MVYSELFSTVWWILLTVQIKTQASSLQRADTEWTKQGMWEHHNHIVHCQGLLLRLSLSLARLVLDIWCLGWWRASHPILHTAVQPAHTHTHSFLSINRERGMGTAVEGVSEVVYKVSSGRSCPSPGYWCGWLADNFTFHWLLRG